MKISYEVESNGSLLCLACGLCCDGVLHNHASIKPEEIDRARALGLQVETFEDGPGFHLPCPLYRNQRCSIYDAPRPRTCDSYRCRLLQQYLAGALTLEQATAIVRRARELLAEATTRLPPGYSYAQLRRDLEEEWDSGRGIFGSAEQRRQNAALLLAIAKLAFYLRKHFEKSKIKNA